MSKISVFSDAQEFLNLDYPCSIVFHNKPYPSLWHAMIAGMTLDEYVQNLLSDDKFIMNQENISKLWREPRDFRDYKMNVVDMVASKYAAPDMLNQLIQYTSDNDEFIYAADPSGVVGSATAMLRKGRSVGEILQALNLQ